MLARVLDMALCLSVCARLSPDFLLGISTAEEWINDLAQQDGRSERDKLDRRRSTTLTVPASSDSRPL